MVDQKETVHLQAKIFSDRDLSSLSDCHRSTLNIIKECSPCSEPKLFITAINSSLECFGGRPLAELRELLGQCVEDLKAGGLVAVVENQFVIADATGAGANKEVIPNEEARSERCDRGLGRESIDQDRDREAPSVPQQMHQAETVDARDAEEAPAEDWDAAPDSAQDMDVLELADELEFVPEESDETALAQDDVAAEPSFYLAQARAAEFQREVQHDRPIPSPL